MVTNGNNVRMHGLRDGFGASDMAKELKNRVETVTSGDTSQIVFRGLGLDDLAESNEKSAELGEAIIEVEFVQYQR
ncbi:hypothetical protein KC350_g79 [Hortaea werneckii]|nr:hypothetical protein KC350_g79 [Hortaea werneckii]